MPLLSNPQETAHLPGDLGGKMPDPKELLLHGVPLPTDLGAHIIGQESDVGQTIQDGVVQVSPQSLPLLPGLVLHLQSFSIEEEIVYGRGEGKGEEQGEESKVGKRHRRGTENTGEQMEEDEEHPYQ